MYELIAVWRLAFVVKQGGWVACAWMARMLVVSMMNATRMHDKYGTRLLENNMMVSTMTVTTVGGSWLLRLQ
jgi:hypothetical protein